MPNKIPPWLPELEKWEQAKYDGIKGRPPRWVPEPFKKKFYAARSMLCLMIYEKNEEWQEIKSRFDKSVESNRYRIVLGLMKDRKDYDEELFFLVDLYVATLLGPEKGLAQLAGDDAVSGLRSRQGYIKRDDHQDKLDCQNIAKKLWTLNPELTIASIVLTQELGSYARKYKGRHTLQDWLGEIDPRPPEKKRGVKRKK
jgi:hypothetical protein